MEKDPDIATLEAIGVLRETKYQPSATELADLQKRFSYHSPKEDQPQRYNDLRGASLMLALGICQNVPPSRERSLALTHLEQAVMWANAGIARNE